MIEPKLVGKVYILQDEHGNEYGKYNRAGEAADAAKDWNDYYAAPGYGDADGHSG